ncbi:hypothetical protein GTS_08900 [Gandjariella thermophila]|uniref:Uncharacterized protein n=1 Tax=Gandjariella thermophila TaxID=1931992 RepID=A0A4D4J5J6_9PSEU|nr:hypothetical protein GTS_08900 [Gandjariella thermophila]
MPGRLRAALVAAAVGALLLAAGAIAGVVSPPAPPAFPAWPMLLVLDLLPVVLAGGFLLRGRAGVAAAVLTAFALIAPGRAVADLQLAVDAGLTGRPELLRPTSLAPLHPSLGLWLLLAGHLATGLAGLLAASRPGAQPEGAARGEPVARVAPLRQGRLAVALCLGLAGAVGLVGRPFTSDDPFLVPRAALDAPVAAMAGGLLVAIAVPLAAVLAASSADPATTRGGLLGIATGVFVLAVPPLAATASVAEVHLTWGPPVALAAAVGLAAFAVPAGRAVPAEDDQPEEPAEVTLPGQARLQTAAGLLAVLTGVAALGGVLAPQLVVPEGVSLPAGYASRLLLPAGLLVSVLGVASLSARLATAVRPALAVAWAAIPLAGAAAGDAVLTASQVGADVRPGVGAWLTGLAVLGSVAVACCAALAGGVERDDVDLTDVRPNPAATVPAAVAAVLAVGAFGLPALRAPDYVEPGVWSDFRVASWGLLVGLATVVGAAVLAPLCRPARRTALLLGAAGVVGVRLLEMPLTGARAEGASAGPGTWLAVACALALLVGALTSARSGTRTAEDGARGRADDERAGPV